MLLFGKLDFFMGGDMIGNFLCAESKLPLIAVAADFQKSRRRSSCRTPASASTNGRTCRKPSPSMSAPAPINTFYAWLRLVYGFKDENIRPYNFNSAPFMQNKTSIQQGYVTAEPYEIEKQGGFKPNIFLLSDYGYDTYSTLIVTRDEIVEKTPDLVQRFVDASAIGWYHYLYGDNSKANEMIKAENPDITDDADRLFDRRDEETRHRRFRRYADAGHRRDDRRALEGFLRQDGGRSASSTQAHRLQEGLHAASSSIMASASISGRSEGWARPSPAMGLRARIADAYRPARLVY